jgi:hypothetical protein
MSTAYQVALRGEMLNYVYNLKVMTEIANDLAAKIDKSRIITINDASKVITMSIKQKDSDLINLYSYVADELQYITGKYKDQLTAESRSTYEEMSNNDFYTFFNGTITDTSGTKKILTIYL